MEFGVERIMFSADHPYGSMAEARAFLDHIPVSAFRWCSMTAKTIPSRFR
jgi:hypothetical protein